MQNKIIISTLSFFIIIEALLIYIALTMTPLQLKRNCFTYEYGETISTKVDDYVNANPNILESVKLDISKVSTQVGKYNASIEYFGKKYPFEIEVIDTVKPKVQLKNVEVQVKLGENLVAKNLIKKVEDYSKTTVYFYDEESKQKMKSKSFVEEGSFVEKIIVEDAYGNQSATLRVKIVVMGDVVKPTFKGIEDIEIVQGTLFDALEGVVAMDNVDGNISNRIQVEGDIDIHVVGEYILSYSVSDSAGNTTQMSRKVTVKPW